MPPAWPTASLACATTENPALLPAFLKLSAEEQSAYTQIKDKWEEDSTRNPFWKKETKSETRELIKKSFRGYTKWLKSTTRPFPLPAEVTHGLLPGDIACTLRLSDGNSIGVIGLNSAFLQLDEGNSQGRLELHIAQLRALCADDYTSWFRKHTLSFLMTHQPVNWLSPRGEYEYLQEINRQGRFLFHFCGHMHENEYSQWKNSFYSSSWQAWMGTSLFSMEPYTIDWGAGASKRIDRRHGYSIGTINLEAGNGTLWPRTVNKHTTFVADTNFAEKGEAVDFSFTRREPGPGPDLFTPDPATEQKIRGFIQTILDQRIMADYVQALTGVIRAEQGMTIEVARVPELLVKTRCPEVIPLLELAFDTCRDCLAKERMDSTNLPIIGDELVKLIGWLVLLNVDSRWRANNTLQKREVSLKIEVPVKTRAGVQVLIASLRDEQPRLIGGKPGEPVRGDGELICGDYPSASWRQKDNLIPYKQQIYKDVMQQEYPPVWNEEAEKQLNIRLGYKNRARKPHYLVLDTIPTGDAENIRLMRALKQDLPNLNIIFVRKDDESPEVFYMEDELVNYIEAFFQNKDRP